MRKLRKLTALVLAMVMTLAMSATVFAGPNGGYSITIKNNVAGHTYEAYQILAGDLSEDETTLSNVKWGSGITAAGQAEFGDAVKFAESLGEIASKSEKADEVANKLGNYLGTVAGSASTVVNDVYTISGLEAGYYLVKDQDGSLDETEQSYTLFILQVVKSVNVEPKADTTTVEKKVKDINDSKPESLTTWQDSADWDIGDDVPFLLTAKLASNVSQYDTYNLVFHDTLSAGLTYNNDAKISIDGKDVTGSFAASYQGTTLTFSCDDVKAIGATNNSVVTVEYTAKLNENAILGSAGNPNKVYLEFSNNPNHNGEGTGKTPEDTVIVFTYKVVVNKIDEDEMPLKGAEFTLYKNLADGSTQSLGVVVSESGTEFTFKGLDDGDYVLKETKTPDGYNTIDDIKFTVTADHEILSDDPRLLDLNGNVTTGAIDLKFEKNLEAGSLSTSVINHKGSVLPSTGGAGRVLIYVFGTVLALGAAIVLVSKRRASR